MGKSRFIPLKHSFTFPYVGESIEREQHVQSFRFIVICRPYEAVVLSLSQISSRLGSFQRFMKIVESSTWTYQRKFPFCSSIRFAQDGGQTFMCSAASPTCGTIWQKHPRIGIRGQRYWSAKNQGALIKPVCKKTQ